MTYPIAFCAPLAIEQGDVAIVALIPGEMPVIFSDTFLGPDAPADQASAYLTRRGWRYHSTQQDSDTGAEIEHWFRHDDPRMQKEWNP